MERRMAQQAQMPKTLEGLIRWFQGEVKMEMPDNLHTQAIWRDRVSKVELRAGQKPVGSSDTGSLAYDDEFRRILENGPSQVDLGDKTVDGRVYFVRPIAAAISRMGRNGHPLTARMLLRLSAAGFDERKVMPLYTTHREVWEVYLREALIRLWREYREWTRSD